MKGRSCMHVPGRESLRSLPSSRNTDWSTGKPDFENPRIGVNSRLLDDFDLDAVPVTVIDGKNLW
jgi:hypothetical protein